MPGSCRIVTLLQSLIDCEVVLILQNPTFVGIIERRLKVLWDLFLAKLLLNAVDDRHDSLDISIEHITFL